MEKMKKLLSIVVASYHAAAFLKRGIPTFLDKRVMKEIEIMIIDDGSEDETAEVADRFQEEYPDTIIVVHKENGGHGSVINKGIELASGKYFCVVDADDWVNTEGLVRLVHKLKEINSDLVLTKAQLRHEDNELVETWEVQAFPKNQEVSVDSYIAELRKIEMHNCCMRTAMLKDHSIRCHEHHFYTDLEWVMFSLFHVETVISLDIIFYQYLVGREGQSVSIEGRRKHFQDYLDIGNWLCEFYERNKSHMSDAMRTHYKRRIAEFLTGVYSLQMSYRSEEKRQELIQFDKGLKNSFPDVYRANENFCVRLLRLSGFRLYQAAAFIYCKVNGI